MQQPFLFPTNMKRDCAYYEEKIGEILDDKYRQIVQKMIAEGKTHEEMVQAILLENAKDVHEAIHIGEDPSTN